MRIHGLTTDRGGCFHYRVRQPLESLRSRGHITSWGSGMDIETWEQADVIVAQYLHHADTVEALTRWAEDGRKLVVWDLDDDITDVTRISGHGTAYDDPATLPRMLRAISAAHLVTVTTPQLAEIVHRHNPRVMVLPNAVRSWLPDHTPPTLDRLTITYTGGPSHQTDLQAWAPTLARYMSRHPATRLRFYGPTHRPDGLPTTWPITTVPWARQTDDYLRQLTGHIGVAPLARIRFNASKSGIKALEYQALGIVPVTADWPQYRAVIDHGRTGILCRTQSDWLEALHCLTTDQATRVAMSAAARAHARYWTQDVLASRWEAAYEEGLHRL